jgi:scavenger receptor class B protein 1
MVNQSLVITTTSEKYYLWQDPPINPEFRIYLFNITNGDNWLEGKDPKIRVNQVGPFVYKEVWKKANVTFHE